MCAAHYVYDELHKATNASENIRKTVYEEITRLVLSISHQEKRVDQNQKLIDQASLNIQYTRNQIRETESYVHDSQQSLNSAQSAVTDAEEKERDASNCGFGRRKKRFLWFIPVYCIVHDATAGANARESLRIAEENLQYAQQRLSLNQKNLAAQQAQHKTAQAQLNAANIELARIAFIYSTPTSNALITTAVQGNPVNVEVYKQFTLDKDSNERINKVTRVVDTVWSMQMITGIQFHTTKGRSSPWYGRQQGTTTYIEQYTGYTVRYVSGRSGDFIDQLQFHWCPN
ncbi:unnamed protein product [Rotaria sp. Silwood2]|nr:unnamed protein product [Rotaria sp. Silwood2]CAF3115818.1 unnamed protein product [Rotaria sp. Silwood2]CAF3352761.1 unnamed protein product [Rotaria sp. Silwood2]CAF3446048.1 unnamed protein product [Rotaria sp. Silwood2]CAF4399156.1 unnamed protein product [Rotaria sp. Silwood2]